MINFVKLYSGHLRSSKKILLIASIGLICALTIVSSTNYYFDNSKKALVDDYLVNFSDNNDQYYSTDLIISFTSLPPYDKQYLSDVLELINQTQKEYNINYFKSINQSVSIRGLSIPVNSSTGDPNFPKYETNSSVQIIELNNELRNELVQLNSRNSLMKNSVLPTSSTDTPEVYVLYFSDYFSDNNQRFLINNSNIVNLYECAYCDPALSNAYPVNVTGLASVNLNSRIYKPDSPPELNPDYNKYPTIQALRSKNYIYTDMVVFTNNLTEFSSILKSQIDYGYGQIYDRTSFFYSLTINFDYSKIDPYNAGAIISQVNSFKSSLYDKIYNQFDLSKSYNFNIDFRAEYKFQSLLNTLNSFLFILMLVSLPVLTATIFVINYSFGLIHSNVVRHIGVYKTRGAGSMMIFLFQLFDNILIMVSSIIIALGTGIPLSVLVLRTDFLLSFNHAAPDYYILNFRSIATLLLYFAVILTIIVNFRRVKRLSRMSIVETEQPVEKEEPSWKKHYVDVTLFSFGMAMYIIFFALVKNPNITRTLGPIMNILVILMIPAPFCLVLGLVLVINRFIPIVLNKIGTLLWDKTGDLLAFSFKNVIRHRQASTRAVMLVAILISFMVFFYALPFSLVLNNERNLYYSNGAEVVGSFDQSGYNETTLANIQANFSQYVNAYTPYLILNTAFTDKSDQFAVMLVNTTTYKQAAYLKFDLGLKNSLSKDLTNLKTSNNTDKSYIKLLIDQQTFEKRKSSIGENITMIGSSNNIKVHIVDSFSNWPILKQRYPSYQSVSLGIGDIDYYVNTLNKSLFGTVFSDITEQGVLFNFKDGVNQTLISSWIEGNTSLTIRSLTAVSQKQYYSGITFRLAVGQINNDVLMVIAISIIVLIMFAYLQISERRKEIFTERALGMKLHQIASLFFIETIILSLTSILLGLAVGVFLMELLALLIFNPSQTYPTFEIVFPFNVILLTTALILLSSFLVSIIPAYYVTRQDISKSFVEG